MQLKVIKFLAPAYKTIQLIRCNHLQANSEALNNALNEQKHVLKVAIIGVPNSGKSTFINNLMDRRVCPTSSKVHTTRTKVKAIFTAGNAQIIFVDTPGLVNDREAKKHHLEKTFTKDPTSSLREVNLIGVLHDVGNRWTQDRLDIKVINLLEQNPSTPSFLVLNKIDLLKSKRKLLDITRLITENSLDGKPMKSNKYYKSMDNPKGWPYFKEVFMVSSLDGNGMADVKNYLVNQATPGEWLYSEDQWSDQSHERIIADMVQAKLLDFLPQEIPYQLKSQLEFCEVDEKGVLYCTVLVHSPSARISKLVAGAGDGKLKQITGEVQKDLQMCFNAPVRISIIMSSPKESK